MWCPLREAIMAVMSAAPQKKAKTKKSKATLNQEVIDSIPPQVITDNDSLGKSWTDRPDSLRMLVECAALLGISDTIDPEGSGSSPDKLASRAVDLINACEFSLKKETMQAGFRVKEQISRLQDLKDFSTHLSFEAGAIALLKIDDDRPERLLEGLPVQPGFSQDLSLADFFYQYSTAYFGPLFHIAQHPPV